VDNEGHLVAIGKAMGRKKSIYTLVETMDRQQDLQKGEPIFISHGDCMDDAEFLKNILATKYPENPVTINHIGPVIGSHSGVGTLALFYRGKARLL
jgi:fatty acid-binding protein DegV